MCCMKFNGILVCIAMRSQNLMPTRQSARGKASITLLQELIGECYRGKLSCYSTLRYNRLPRSARWLSTLALQLRHAFFNMRIVLNCSSRFPLIRARQIRIIARRRNSSCRRRCFSARFFRTCVPLINSSFA